jgi:tryptophan synthase beta chain
VKKLTTETGAGQWGTALAFACALYDMECEIWQVGASYDAKPYRRLMIEAFGGQVHRSPSELTEVGRAHAADPANLSGRWGWRSPRPSRWRPRTRDPLRAGICAQSRAAASDRDRRRGDPATGEAGDTPTLIVGCTGGGSNFAGLSFPFLREKLAGKISPRILPRSRRPARR